MLSINKKTHILNLHIFINNMYEAYHKCLLLFFLTQLFISVCFSETVTAQEHALILMLKHESIRIYSHIKRKSFLAEP